jgi:3-phosphoshikimate 1-carboxyvinyltransferase
VKRTVVVRVPGDKSITHRALMFSSLATGTSIIRGALQAADTHSTMNAMRALGISMPPDLTDDFHVHGAGLRGLHAPSLEIDCGNSGTTARLLMGMVAGSPFDALVTGDASLRSRPMRRVTTPLSQMGAGFTEHGQPDRLPIRVHGRPLVGIDFLNTQCSAQVKSALLLAGFVGDVPVTVTERRLSRDHSERMLAAMGLDMVRAEGADASHSVRISGAAELQPLDIVVPGDFSSAAFFIACGLLMENVEIVLPGVGLNPGRIGMLDVLRRMNADVSVTEEVSQANEPTGEIRVSARSLGSATVTAADVPAMIDEIPILAALATQADGETRITGASELRVKETDRIRAMVENLRAIGADADELEDGMVIRGSRRPLRGAIRTHGDHRIAMSFGVLGSLPGNEIAIDDPAVVDVSYPAFWQDLASVTAVADVA